MKTNTLVTSLFVAAAGLMSPTVSLASVGDGAGVTTPLFETGPIASEDDGTYETARRGRGRGRGGDRDRDDDRRDDRHDDSDDDHRDDHRDDGSSGRDKPRIPGGSGCDDPGDVAEHPECRV